jgi:hypothetical protein
MIVLQISGVFGNGRTVIEGDKLALSPVRNLASLLAPAASASCFPSPLLLLVRLPLRLLPSLYPCALQRSKRIDVYVLRWQWSIRTRSVLVRW